MERFGADQLIKTMASNDKQGFNSISKAIFSEPAFATGVSWKLKSDMTFNADSKVTSVKFPQCHCQWGLRPHEVGVEDKEISCQKCGLVQTWTRWKRFDLQEYLKQDNIGDGRGNNARRDPLPFTFNSSKPKSKASKKALHTKAGVPTKGESVKIDRPIVPMVVPQQQIPPSPTVESVNDEED